MTKASELRQLEGTDMVTKLNEAQKELFNLRFQLATGRLDNFGRIATLKREIARILTLQSEEEYGISPRARTSTKVHTPKPAATTAKKSSKKDDAKAASKDAEDE